MSPNGRRAWRKWCKRARLRMNKHHRALYRGAIMRKKQPERTPLPAKPFTPRSLVGMTQGARKRRVRTEYADLCRVPDFALMKAATLATWDESELEAGVQRWAAKRSELRAKYRIGQKLRPCPGCEECRGYYDEIGVVHCDGRPLTHHLSCGRLTVDATNVTA